MAMMQNAMKMVSNYGFDKDHVRCSDCGARPQLMIVAGEADGKFAAFQVECTGCCKATTLNLFYKFGDDGHLKIVNPYAREQTELEWEELNADEP